LALGASYATANLRTLVVDCDLIAGGLTRRVEAIVRRKLGQILIAQGLLDEDQLNEALEFAGHSARRLGEVLVDLGFVSEQDVDRAIVMQKNESAGILDAMGGRPIDECVGETGITNLWILPVGNATARDVPLLSPEALHRLIDAVGQRFDVVLVDTGPILGSLEASLVSGIVDGVVLTVCKGEQRPVVERAMSQLVTVGARVAGVVFNRASDEDVSVYGSSSNSRVWSGPVSRPRSSAGYPAAPASAADRRLGPLAAAVTTCAPGLRAASDPVDNELSVDLS
jgi:Mrp family chromosome partitioning ATPase